MQNARTKNAAAGALAFAVSLGCLAAAAPAPAPDAAVGPAPASGALAPAPSTPASGAPVSKIAWKPCPAQDPVMGAALKDLQCGTLGVPLDHAAPRGKKITLALTRARHTARRSQGVVLLNRGGPGAVGRDLAALFSRTFPKDLVSQYDWIGFDPRGVGASKPALICDTSYQNPGRARPDTVPANEAEEKAWLDRARAFAADCGRKYGDVLPHMGTRNWVQDMESIRVALGQERISYFGYSYGTYLGAAYATAHPDRVRRMVLDSVVRPSGVWYSNNLDQNMAFEKRIHAFFAWVAKHHGTYRLGSTREEVAAAYGRTRTALKARPIDGKLGPTELDDTYLIAGYTDQVWPSYANALTAHAVRKDPKPLLKVFKPPKWVDQNSYAMYSAVQCRDAPWPRDWRVWHRDHWGLYRSGYRFETWGNAWFNAPCAFWPVQGGPPPAVRGSVRTPPMLLVQSTEDAATPYPGALEMHRLFPTSRLIVQQGSGNHGITLGGDRCIDPAAAAYLKTGRLPADRPGPDAACPAGPEPRPERQARPGPERRVRPGAAG